MALLLFPLVAYLAAVAYLVAWLIRQVSTTFNRVRDWQHQRSIVFSMKAWNKVGDNKDGLINLAGALLGGAAAIWLAQVFIREWLLIVFVVLAVLSEEMRISTKEMQLLEVLIFFNRLATHNEGGQDLFEALSKVIQECLEGEVQQSVRESVFRRRSGESFEGSLKAIRGINPFLDEFALTLQLSGWQNGLGLNIILSQLIARVGRKWDRTSRSLYVKDKYRTYVLFGRSVVVSSLWLILVSRSSAITLAMTDRAVIVLIILTLSGLGIIFYLFLTKQLLRRFLAVSIFILSLAAYANSLIVPIPAWIQVETISYQSDGMRDASLVTSQFTPLNQGMSVSLTSAFLNEPAISETPNPTSTPTPTVMATKTLLPPALIATTMSAQEFDLCCLHSRQPR